MLDCFSVNTCPIKLLRTKFFLLEKGFQGGGSVRTQDRGSPDQLYFQNKGKLIVMNNCKNAQQQQQTWLS